MLSTKRKPVSVGEMLTEEFLTPMRLTQGALAVAMAWSASWSTSFATTAAL
jgi:plasmid maintenance system antidote protein VapI